MLLEEFEAWQVSFDLAREVLQACSGGVLSKQFALRDQIVRAAISIPSNIAEGYERDGNREFIQHLSIAKGSVGELRTQLLLAKCAGYISPEKTQHFIGLCLSSSRLIAGLMRYLQESEHKGLKFK